LIIGYWARTKLHVLWNLACMITKAIIKKHEYLIHFQRHGPLEKLALGYAFEPKSSKAKVPIMHKTIQPGAKMVIGSNKNEKIRYTQAIPKEQNIPKIKLFKTGLKWYPSPKK